MSAARHLRVIDADGVELDGCPACAIKDDEVAGLQRDIRGWAARYAELKRDKDAEARANPLWPLALKLFGEWQTRCRHPRAEWTADRFYECEPYLKRDGYDRCVEAIKGAEYDCFQVKRRNGSTRRFDEWERIFNAKRGKFEEWVNKCPREAAAA